MPSMSRNSATDCGYEMHHTSTVGTPRIRNAHHAAKLRREKPRWRGPTSATHSAPSGSACDRAIRPRYHVGTPHHEVATSTATVAAHTHSTAGEIGHEAHPVHRHAHPVERAASVRGATTARGAPSSWSIRIDPILSDGR